MEAYAFYWSEYAMNILINDCSAHPCVCTSTNCSSAMWGVAPCLLLVSAVTVTDARQTCTTCPNNACSQNEAHIG